MMNRYVPHNQGIRLTMSLNWRFVMKRIIFIVAMVLMMSSVVSTTHAGMTRQQQASKILEGEEWRGNSRQIYLSSMKHGKGLGAVKWILRSSSGNVILGDRREAVVDLYWLARTALAHPDELDYNGCVDAWHDDMVDNLPNNAGKQYAYDWYMQQGKKVLNQARRDEKRSVELGKIIH
jgi:hypothetical protein